MNDKHRPEADQNIAKVPNLFFRSLKKERVEFAMALRQTMFISEARKLSHKGELSPGSAQL